MAKILLAEDDEMIQRMISLRLKMRAHQVDHAGDGAQAVAMATSQDYDLILMDMHMPRMDGHEATTRLREQGYGGLIVAVTASAMSADSDKAIKAGCDAHIAKPIGADFEDRLEDLLEARGT